MKSSNALKVLEGATSTHLLPTITKTSKFHLKATSETTSTDEIVSISNARIYRQDALRFLSGLPSESVDLIITDPAYSGMNQHLMLGKGRIVGQYENKGDDDKWFKEFHDTQENYLAFLEQCKRVLKKDSHLFIMFDSFSLLSLGLLVRGQFNVKNILTWDKVNFGMGHYFRRQTEFILFASKGKRPISRRDIPDIWPIKRLHKTYYPTQKPVELFEAMIASSRHQSDKDYIVCDPFVGSGSSALAALKQGVSFLGCDISYKAVGLCRSRLEAFTTTGQDIYQPKPAVEAGKHKKFW